MSSFSVTPEELAACANQLQSGAQQIQDINNQLEARVQQVAGVWTGQAHARFQDVYTQWKTAQTNLQQSLAQLAQMTQQASVTYADTEQQIAGSFNR